MFMFRGWHGLLSSKVNLDEKKIGSQSFVHGLAWIFLKFGNDPLNLVTLALYECDLSVH